MCGKSWQNSSAALAAYKRSCRRAGVSPVRSVLLVSRPVKAKTPPAACLSPFGSYLINVLKNVPTICRMTASCSYKLNASSCCFNQRVPTLPNNFGNFRHCVPLLALPGEQGTGGGPLSEGRGDCRIGMRGGGVCRRRRRHIRPARANTA